MWKDELNRKANKLAFGTLQLDELPRAERKPVRAAADKLLEAKAERDKKALSVEEKPTKKETAEEKKKREARNAEKRAARAAAKKKKGKEKDA